MRWLSSVFLVVRTAEQWTPATVVVAILLAAGVGVLAVVLIRRLYRDDERSC